MNFALEPHQLVAHWVPGFFLLVILLVHPSLEAWMKPLLCHGGALLIVVFGVLAFICGEFLDAARDLLEHVWDRRERVNGDFFFTAKAEQIEKLEGAYFTYYVFNHNLVLPLLYLSIVGVAARHSWIFLWGLIPTFLLIADAFSLRAEIARHTRSPSDAAKNP